MRWWHLLLAIVVTVCSFGSSDAAPSGVHGSEYKAAGRCGAFPRARVTTPPWLCVGIVAGPDHGLISPRSILQVAENRFIITDMVGWSARGKGRILQLTFDADGAAKLSPLYSDRNLPHGLALGPDGLVYVGDDDSIWRFDPKQDGAPPETLVSGLPDKRSFGGDHWHPLKHIVFDNNGDLLVNMGAPDDGCRSVPGTTAQWPFPCTVGEGAGANAALWKLQFDWPSGKPGAFAPLARGLRNSVALAVHPKSDLILQAENGADGWNGVADPDLPPDELNIIQPERHYGWPYCAGVGIVAPEYRARVKKLRGLRTAIPADPRAFGSAGHELLQRCDVPGAEG